MQKSREKISVAVRMIAICLYCLSLTLARKALEVLQEIFPEFQPPSTETETCAVCEALAASGREASKEARAKAEVERVSTQGSRWIHSDNVTRAAWALYPAGSSLGH